MIKNYFKIAFRNIRRSKGFSLINISGLAIGMASSILILLWVQFELSYDKFHQNYHHIYRVMSYGTKYMIDGFEGTPPPFAPAIGEQIPGIMNTLRLMDVQKMVVKYEDKVFYEKKMILTESSFFEMFSFPFLRGDPQTALSDPHHAIITEATADKYFGKENPLGKIISLDGTEMKVAGVVRNIVTLLRRSLNI